MSKHTYVVERIHDTEGKVDYVIHAACTSQAKAHIMVNKVLQLDFPAHEIKQSWELGNRFVEIYSAGDRPMYRITKLETNYHGAIGIV